VQDSQDEGVWFGQLRTLLSCRSPSGMLMELAMIRWYETVATDDDCLEGELGLQKVKWETIGRGRSFVGERYDVVDVRTIIKAVFLQPHPTEKDQWFYNHFV
jgi:hypothetical protein